MGIKVISKVKSKTSRITTVVSRVLSRITIVMSRVISRASRITIVITLNPKP